jgi:hypothetical protein
MTWQRHVAAYFAYSDPYLALAKPNRVIYSDIWVK